MPTTITPCPDGMVELEALVNYESAHQAKALGYWWQQQTRRWIKRVPRCEVLFEMQRARFAILNY